MSVRLPVAVTAAVSPLTRPLMAASAFVSSEPSYSFAAEPVVIVTSAGVTVRVPLTVVMFVKEAVEGIDFVAFITVYEGYMIEFDMLASPTAEEGLTEAQIQMCVDFLSDLDFIPEEA